MGKRVLGNGAALTSIVDNESVGVEVNRDDSVSSSARPLWLTVPMVAGQLSLGKTKVYELIELGGLPVVRVGRAVRIPTLRFLKWVEEFEKQSLSA